MRLSGTNRYGPPMNTDEHGFDSLTERVLAAIFEVSNTLGAGFLEKVYQRALLAELRLRGIRATAEASFAVIYKGQPQCLNYLRASGRTLCLLVNFRKPKVEWKRIVHGFPVPKAM